jgi:hypothetical protein
MATVTESLRSHEPTSDMLSGTPRAHAIDRWIFVFMAMWFIAIVLTGFIPDSIMKVGLVEAGKRPPFPLVLHLHAVLMGSFLLLLLAQTWLMATGRTYYHVRLGLLAFVLAPALVLVGFILAPTMYHQLWEAFQAAPPEAREKARAAVLHSENVKLIQIRAGLLFPLFLILGLRARSTDSGLHKRMMILATAVPLTAGIDRIHWVPTSMPVRPASVDAFLLLAVAPMFAWDVIRNRRVHRAYWIWLALFIPSAVVVGTLWDTPWWHITARHIMGV